MTLALAIVVSMVPVSAALPPGGQGPSPAPVVLAGAGGQYLEEYEKKLPGVVAEEDYLQRVETATEALARRLRSDVLMMADPTAGVIEFRDVFEVDGASVRDRSDRLARRFLRPASGAGDQARRIVDEGARFNLDPTRGSHLARTINTPLLALRYLRAEDQTRSRFSVERKANGASDSELVLAFHERAKPRIISSSDDAPASGWFRLDPGTGRVTESEVMVRTGAVTATIRVLYGEVPALALWLPLTMTERYELGPGRTVHGRATYFNFRRFQVNTSVDIKQ